VDGKFIDLIYRFNRKYISDPQSNVEDWDIYWDILLQLITARTVVSFLCSKNYFREILDVDSLKNSDFYADIGVIERNKQLSPSFEEILRLIDQHYDLKKVKFSSKTKIIKLN
jgi:hypothetical protein